MRRQVFSSERSKLNRNELFWKWRTEQRETSWRLLLFLVEHVASILFSPRHLHVDEGAVQRMIACRPGYWSTFQRLLLVHWKFYTAVCISEILSLFDEIYSTHSLKREKYSCTVVLEEAEIGTELGERRKRS